jgi:hypothetical protein
MEDMDELVTAFGPGGCVPRTDIFHNSSVYPEYDLHITDEIGTIDHVIEDHDGVIGVMTDGTKVRLDGYIGTICMRIRYFLELIAGEDTITEDMVMRLRELKEILHFEDEEVQLARKRVAWAEEVLLDRML